MFYAEDRIRTNSFPLLSIKAKSLEVIEEQDAYWKKQLGDKYNNYYEQFKRLREKRKYIYERFDPKTFFV